MLEISSALADMFSQNAFAALINLLVIFIELIYVLYAFIIVRQVALLNRTLNTGAAPLFGLISFIHLLMSIGIVVISILGLLA